VAPEWRSASDAVPELPSGKAVTPDGSKQAAIRRQVLRLAARKQAAWKQAVSEQARSKPAVTRGVRAGE
jgi:hypothetical protein